MSQVNLTPEESQKLALASLALSSKETLSIPSAQMFEEINEQKRTAYREKVAQQAKDKATAYTKQMNRLRLAASEFVELFKAGFLDAIKESLKSPLASSRIEVIAPSLGNFRGLPGDVLLYGHRLGGQWQKRHPLELSVMPFQQLQQIFHDRGWYLIEESDPARSYMIIFALYPKKPFKSAYFDVAGKLWHGNNMIYREPSPPEVPLTIYFSDGSQMEMDK